MGRSAQRPCIWTQYMPSGGAVVSSSCLSVRPGSLLAMEPACQTDISRTVDCAPRHTIARNVTKQSCPHQRLFSSRMRQPDPSCFSFSLPCLPLWMHACMEGTRVGSSRAPCVCRFDRDPPPTVRQREHAYKIGAKASLFLRPRSQNRSQLRGVRDLCKFGQPDGGSITSELCVREISRLA